MFRLVVSKKKCQQPCFGCMVCNDEKLSISLAQAQTHLKAYDSYILGGGDVINWQPLFEFLEYEKSRNKEIALEVPVHKISREILTKLKKYSVKKIILQTNAFGEKLEKYLATDSLKEKVKLIEKSNLAIEIRLMVTPQTFSVVVPLAVAFRGVKIWLEINRKNLEVEPVQLSKALAGNYNIYFSGHRVTDAGYLPPCLLFDQWKFRPDIWQSLLLEEGKVSNNVFVECKDCALKMICQFKDKNSVELSNNKVCSIEAINLPWKQKIVYLANKEITEKKISNLLCTKPWTTFQVSDLDGVAHQCCSTWTHGNRGNIFEKSIGEIWFGDGYTKARKLMLTKEYKKLCKSICPRVYDRKKSLNHFKIIDGSKEFVSNQRLIYQEMIQGISKTKAKPLYMALCPSTYCNYDCIMCLHGRTPTRNLPGHIWQQIEEFLPTLHNLTLLGGEPLANKKVLEFLESHDRVSFPDLNIDLITNGSLLNKNTLKRLRNCNFGALTISVNAGSDEVYENVMRGYTYQQLLQNLEDVCDYRASQNKWFDITLSFVVQPKNSFDLINFIELAQSKNFNIRLIPLSPDSVPELNFYGNKMEHDKVLYDIEKAIKYIKIFIPIWNTEITALYESVKNCVFEDPNVVF